MEPPKGALLFVVSEVENSHNICERILTKYLTNKIDKGIIMEYTPELLSSGTLDDNQLMDAIKKDPANIRYTIPQSESLQLEAIKRNPWVIEYIETPSEKVQLAAVERRGNAIKHIKHPFDSVKVAAVKAWGPAIKYIEDQSEEIKLIAAQFCNKYDSAIPYIKDPSPEVKLAAVRADGSNIKYFDNPSEEMQLKVITSNSLSIQDTKDPSYELQLAAVKRDPKAIQFIKNPSEDLAIMAVTTWAGIIDLIDNPSDTVQLEAVKRFPNDIRFLKSPSKEVQLAAVSRSYKTIEIIKHPCEEAVKLSKELEEQDRLEREAEEREREEAKYSVCPFCGSKYNLEELDGGCEHIIYICAPHTDNPVIEPFPEIIIESIKSCKMDLLPDAYEAYTEWFEDEYMYDHSDVFYDEEKDEEIEPNPSDFDEAWKEFIDESVEDYYYTFTEEDIKQALACTGKKDLADSLLVEEREFNWGEVGYTVYVYYLPKSID